MRLLVTGALDLTPARRARLEAMGHEVLFARDELTPLREQGLPFDPARAEGAVCNALFLHNDLDELPLLRYVQLTSAGLDRVPAERMRARGVELRSARGVYSAPMAESAVAGVLALYRGLPTFWRRQEARAWEKRRDLRELAGSGVCVVGCGSVGTECARRFSALGCDVWGVDLAPYASPDYTSMRGVGEAADAVAEADVVVATLPLTPGTRGLFGAGLFAAMRRRPVFVNVARGAVADEAALAAALSSGLLSGAVLDVFEEEPLPASSPLWDMPNVLVTPHNSFVSTKNADRLFDLVERNLEEHERRQEQ